MTQNQAASAPPPAGTHGRGLAIASILCGALGLVTCGASAILGLILGIIALLKTGRSDQPSGPRGLAIAGIVVSAAMIAIGPVAGLPMLGLLIIFRDEMKDWVIDIWEQARDEAEGEHDDFFDAPLEGLGVPLPRSGPMLVPVRAAPYGSDRGLAVQGTTP